MQNRFNDLLLLNYYEGWFSGAIQDESYIGDAVEFYFGWLTGIANEYDIPTDYEECPDGCQALHEDIEEYLKDNIIWGDLVDISNEVMFAVQSRYNDEAVFEDSVLEIIDNIREVSELIDSIYFYCLEEVKKEYNVI